MGKNKNKWCVKGGPSSHNKGQKGDRDSLPDVSQQLDEVIGGDFAAVLSVQGRKLAIHVQASLSIFEHLPGNTFPKSQWLRVSSNVSGITLESWEILRSVLLGCPGEGHPEVTQALTCLFGGFEHFLSCLQRHKQGKYISDNLACDLNGGIIQKRCGGEPCSRQRF